MQKRDAFERKRPVPTVDVTSLQRHEAEIDSRACPYCSTSGLAVIYHPDYDGCRTIQDAEGKIHPAIVRAYCVCPMGDWMRYNQEKTCPEVYRKMPELHDVLSRRIRWLAHDPRDDPSEEPDETIKPSDWRKLVHKFADNIHARAKD